VGATEARPFLGARFPTSRQIISVIGCPSAWATAHSRSDWCTPFAEGPKHKDRLLHRGGRYEGSLCAQAIRCQHHEQRARRCGGSHIRLPNS